MGLRWLVRYLTAAGVFGRWSDDPPDERFVRVREQVFGEVRAEVVGFAHVLTGGTSSDTTYLRMGTTEELKSS